MKANGQSCLCKNRGNAGAMRHSAGFTLIEAVIVVAAIAVLSAAAVPSVNGYFTRHALQYATNELYGDMQLARMRAAKNNQRCRVVFNQPLANQYIIQDVDNNGAVIRTFKIGDLSKFRDRITFCQSPAALDPNPFITFEFLSQGILNLPAIAPPNSNSIYLTNKSNSVHYRILVSAAGGTSMDRWDTTLTQWR